MKKIIKFHKKVISLFLAVMMINTMAFTGVTAWAAWPGGGSDTTEPTLNLTASTTAWTNGTVTITANASNCSNGVKYIKLPDTDETKVYDGTASYTVSANGSYTFKVKDNAGNTTSKSITISNIDTTAPTLTFTKSPTGATNGTVTITATASDSGSGVASIKKPDGSVATGRSTTYAVSENGSYNFTATDNAGNTSTQVSYTVSNIDTTAPTLTFTQNPGATNGTVTITATASDSGSGVASITKPDGKLVTGGTATYTVNENGPYNFTATDNAGNTSLQVSYTVSNIIDNTAPTTGLTISVNDSSNQSIPQYTNNGHLGLNDIFDNPVRLAANATAKISYNFTNATMAKYQFVQASNLNPVPDFPQDSTMTNINLSTPNSHDAYANDIGDRGTISTMQYVYAGTPGSASSTAQLTRDVSFGTPLSSTMLVQNATVGSDIPDYTNSSSRSNAFLSNQTLYSSDWSSTKTPQYYVKDPYKNSGNAYRYPTTNAAWKAMKFWGYFSPSQSGYYNLGAYSDDGAYGYLIVNGQTKEFVNDWTIKSAFNRTKNNPIYLTANSYYPIYMEWYEGCPTQGAFTPVYQFSSQSSTDALSSSWSDVPQNYFYSSKTTTPGTIPGAYFGDVSGIPFPTQDGIYYIATKFVSGVGSEDTTSGLYGPFIIDTTPPTISLDVVSDNSSSNKKAVVGNTLTINFTASEALQANPQILVDGYVANATYTNISGNDYTATVKIANDGSINSSGDKITQSGPINVQIAHYSDLSGNVGSPVQDSSVTFINAAGITLTLTQNPIATVLTNGNVTITANAIASGSGNGIQTIKYAAGNQPVNYFTAGGTIIYSPSGAIQSTVQSTFNVNTNGVYTVYTTDSVGNVAVQTIDVENIYATPPVITEPKNGTITNNNKPTIKGTGEAGATVTVYDNGTSIGTALVQSDGTWILTLNTALSDGTHPITAKQQNSAGNVSAVSNTVNITIDTTVAAPVITTPADNTVTNDNTPTISGTAEANSTVKVYDGTTLIGTVTADGSGNWTLTPSTGLADGTHAITATATDAAGNVSPASNTVNITIAETSSILAHGLYNGNGTDIVTGNGVTAGIPATLAMIVDVKSSNPVINWSVTDTEKIPVADIIFKKYAISSDGTIDKSSLVGGTLNNGKIDFTNPTMGTGKYIIVYTITPKKSGAVTLTASADGTTSKDVSLNIGDQPDLF